jgi:hypothetical protein
MLNCNCKTILRALYTWKFLKYSKYVIFSYSPYFSDIMILR